MFWIFRTEEAESYVNSYLINLITITKVQPNPIHLVLLLHLQMAIHKSKIMNKNPPD